MNYKNYYSLLLGLNTQEISGNYDWLFDCVLSAGADINIEEGMFYPVAHEIAKNKIFSYRKTGINRLNIKDWVQKTKDKRRWRVSFVWPKMKKAWVSNPDLLIMVKSQSLALEGIECSLMLFFSKEKYELESFLKICDNLEESLEDKIEERFRFEAPWCDFDPNFFTESKHLINASMSTFVETVKQKPYKLISKYKVL